MRKWTTMWLVVCAIILLLVLAGCATNSSNTSTTNIGTNTGKKIEIKLAHHLSDKSGSQQAFEKFAQIAMQDDPELDIKIYPNSQLGTEKDAISQVKSGNLQMTLGDMASFAAYDKKLPVIGLPFIFLTYDSFYKVVDGDVGKQLSKELLDKTGLKTLAYMEAGLRDIYTTKPVKNLNDLKGLKLRVPEAALYTDTFNALGTNPTSVPAAQMYTSLQTGVVNGMEGTIETAYTFKIGEVAKYCYESHHMNTDTELIINDKFFNNLPNKAQNAILHAAKESEKFQRDNLQVVETDFKEKLKQMGVQFTPADLTSLEKEVQPVYDKFISETGAGDLIKLIKANK